MVPASLCRPRIDASEASYNPSPSPNNMSQMYDCFDDMPCIGRGCVLHAHTLKTIAYLAIVRAQCRQEIKKLSAGANVFECRQECANVLARQCLNQVHVAFQE